MLTDVGQAGTNVWISANADCYYVSPFFAKPLLAAAYFGGRTKQVKMERRLLFKVWNTTTKEFIADGETMDLAQNRC